MGGGALPAPPGCAPPDWLLVVAAARSAFTGAGSESVELERPRRPRTAVQLPPPCSLEPRSDAGRTQTGWKELGPRGGGGAEGGRERCPEAPAYPPTREDLLLFRRAASPQQLLSALEPALLTLGPGAVAGVSPLPCAEGACARTKHGCPRARAPRGGASQETLCLDQACLGKGAPLRPWDRWEGGRGAGTGHRAFPAAPPRTE